MARKSVGAGAELTKHNCKYTTKCNCLYKNTAKFLLHFQKASVTVSSAEAVHIVLCLEKWKSVGAVDDKQDISLRGLTLAGLRAL